MKKLTAFVICVLLLTSVLSVQAFAAAYTPSVQQPAAPANPAAPAEPVVPEVPVDLGNSSVVIDGKVVQGDKLEEAGLTLKTEDAVLTDEAMATASEPVKAAYEAVMNTPVTELTYEDDGKELEKQAKQAGVDASKLVVSNIVEVKVVDIADPNNVYDSDKVKVTIQVPYASAIKLVLYRLPDGTWKVVPFKVNLANKNGNGNFDVDSITIEGGGTGVYVFLTDEDSLADITGGKYDRENLFN